MDQDCDCYQVRKENSSMKKMVILAFIGLMLIEAFPVQAAGPTGLNKLPSKEEIEQKRTHEWRQKVLDALLAIEDYLRILSKREEKKKNRMSD